MDPQICVTLTEAHKILYKLSVVLQSADSDPYDCLHRCQKLLDHSQLLDKIDKTIKIVSLQSELSEKQAAEIIRKVTRLQKKEAEADLQKTCERLQEANNKLQSDLAQALYQAQQKAAYTVFLEADNEQLR